MHRITKLKIENYRGFYGSYTLDLPKGENLLLYGENGSGKSSLLLAFREWLMSSEKDWKITDFEEQANLFTSQGTQPVIEVCVDEFVSDPVTLFPYSSQNHVGNYACIASPNRGTRNPIVSQMRERHGFLTYRTLLETYLVKNNNLFWLIILGILGDIKISGSTRSIREKWQAILKYRTMNKSRKLSEGIDREIPAFNAEIVELIQNWLQPTCNGILEQFFTDSHLQISIGTPDLELPLERTGPNNRREFEGAEIKIGVDLSTQPIPKHETILNEARLNAISIALFLSGRLIQDRILRNSQGILLLDDIFIGLDTSNRIPLLKLLTEKKLYFKDQNGRKLSRKLFAEYQIVISTYDRYWFNVAQQWLKSRHKDRWLAYEMYVYPFGSNGTGGPFDQPILKPYGDNLGTGMRYFRDKHHPDYTAAANFFRKSAEELLNKFLPPKILEKVRNDKKNKRNDDTNPEPESVMLKDLIGISMTLLEQVHESTTVLIELRGHLRTLLNPLSHFEREQSPVFRQELQEILVILRDKLPPFLDNVKVRMKEVLPRENTIRLRFLFGPRHYGYYDLITKTDLYSVIDPVSGVVAFSKVEFKVSNANEFNGLIEKAYRNTPRKEEVSSFSSLSDAYNAIYDHLVAIHPTMPRATNIAASCKYLIDGKRPRPLAELL